MEKNVMNVKEARANFCALLDKAQEGDEVVIVRRDKKVVRLVPMDEARKRLPDLSAFRASIAVEGDPLSRVVLQARDEERY